MKDQLLNEEILKGGKIKLVEAQSYFRQGDIFYPKTSKYCSLSFKTRPVMIASIIDNVEDDVIIGYEITSNFFTPSQVPILLDTRISFISPFREHMFSFDDIQKSSYYGSVDLRVLEIIKYIKIKHLCGIYSEVHEEYLKRYCEECLKNVEAGKIRLRRSTIPSASVRSSYLGGTFSNNKQESNNIETPVVAIPTDEEDAVLVYSERHVFENGKDTESFPTIGDLITPEIRAMVGNVEEEDNEEIKTDLEKKIETADKHEKDEILTNKVSPNTPELPVYHNKTIKVDKDIDLNLGYWFRRKDTLYLKENAVIDSYGKLAFLRDVHKSNSMSAFAKRFRVTGQTIRNRIDKYILDLEKESIDIPADIMVSLVSKKVSKKSTSSKTKKK